MANEYFTVMTSIINKKNISDELILQHYNGWAAFKWLSGHPQALYESNLLNTARGNKYIGKIEEYKTLKGLIHLKPNTYIKMDKNDKLLNTLIKLITTHYQVGKSTAKEYLKTLSYDELVKLLETYGRMNENYMSASDTKKIQEYRVILKNKNKLKELNV